MKKILLSLLVIFVFISISPTTLAANKTDTTYQVKIEPISAGIKIKALKVHGTDVAVINYTDYTVNVNYAAYYNFTLTPRTSGRITSEAVQSPYIVITKSNGEEVFRNSVPNYATVSVYASVVYVTNNP